MDRIRRSFLRSTDDVYYKLLGLSDRNASQQAIKEAFLNLSATCHPHCLSKIGIDLSPANITKFLKVTDAYNVLSDIKRRRMYDEIGFVGLRLVEKPFLDDPSKSATLSFQGTVYVPIFYAAIPSFFLLSILLSLKCDGYLRLIPWAVVWTPVWLIDIGGVILAAKLFFDHGKKESGMEESSENVITRFFPDLIAIVSTILFVLTQVFICLKLDAHMNWDWFTVLSPWLAHEFLECMVLAPTACSLNFSPDFNLAFDEESCETEILIEKMLEETKYFQVLLATATERKAFLGHLLRGFLAISLALKLNDQVEWSWFIVYVPVWMSLLSQLLFSHYFRNWGNRIVESVELVANDAVSCTRIMIKGQEVQQLHEVSYAFMKRSFVLIYFAVLSVVRLEVHKFSTFIIVLPVTLFLGLLGLCYGLHILIGCVCGAENTSVSELTNLIKKESGRSAVHSPHNAGLAVRPTCNRVDPAFC